MHDFKIAKSMFYRYDKINCSLVDYMQQYVERYRLKFVQNILQIQKIKRFKLMVCLASSVLLSYLPANSIAQNTFKDDEANVMLNLFEAELQVKQNPQQAWANYIHLANQHKHAWFAKRALEIAINEKAWQKAKSAMQIYQQLQNKHIENFVLNDDNLNTLPDSVDAYLKQALIEFNFKEYSNLNDLLKQYADGVYAHYQKSLAYVDAKKTDDNLSLGNQRKQIKAQLNQRMIGLLFVFGSDETLLNSAINYALTDIQEKTAYEVRAQALIRSKQMSEAKTIILEAIEKYELKNELQESLKNSKEEDKNLNEKNLKTNESNLKIEKKTPTTLQLLLIETQNLDEQIESLKTLKKNGLDTLSTNQTLATKLFTADKKQEALTLLLELKEANPEHIDISFILAQLYRTSKEFAKAEQVINDLQEQYSQLPEAINQFMVDMAQQQDNYALSNTWLKKMPATQARTLQQLKNATRLNDYEEVDRLFATIIKDVDVSKQALLYQLSIGLWREVGQPQRAINQAQQLLALSPNDYNLHLLLANLYYEAKQFAPMAQYLKQAIALDTKRGEAYNFLGYSYLEDIKDVSVNQALELIEQAVKIEPKNPAYLDSLGWAWFKKGDLKQAQTYLNQAWQLSLVKELEMAEHLLEVNLSIWQQGQNKQNSNQDSNQNNSEQSTESKLDMQNNLQNLNARLDEEKQIIYWRAMVKELEAQKNKLKKISSQKNTVQNTKQNHAMIETDKTNTNKPTDENQDDLDAADALSKRYQFPFK